MKSFPLSTWVLFILVNAAQHLNITPVSLSLTCHATRSDPLLEVLIVFLTSMHASL